MVAGGLVGAGLGEREQGAGGCGGAAVCWALSVRCGLGLGGAVFGVWCWCGSVLGGGFAQAS